MEETRKRSRFDQTEPEPKRSSQLQRRSRSPSSRKTSTHRSRSPVNASNDAAESEGKKGDPAAAAAAAAARINAQIQAKKSVQHVDVPLIRSVRLHIYFYVIYFISDFPSRHLQLVLNHQVQKRLQAFLQKYTRRTAIISETSK